MEIISLPKVNQASCVRGKKLFGYKYKGCGARSIVIVPISKNHLSHVKDKPRTLLSLNKWSLTESENLVGEHPIASDPASVYNLTKSTPDPYKKLQQRKYGDIIQVPRVYVISWIPLHGGNCND